MAQKMLRVLLVDDDEDLLKPLAKYLHQVYGCKVDAAANAHAALMLLEEAEGNYDVALIDDLLVPAVGQEPEPMGVILTKEFKARYPDIEIIVFTGRGMDSALEALRAGAYRYLAKPLNFDELEMLIQTAVEHRQLKGAAREKQILERLMETSQALISGQSLTEILDTILRGVQAIGFDRVCLYLLSEDCQTMVGKAQVNVGEQFVGHKRLVATDAQMQILLTDPRPHVFEREDDNPLPFERELGREGVNQWACVPLVLQGEVIGKLSMDNKFSQRPIIEVELRLIGLFAAQAATAIEKMRLRAKEQENVQKVEQRAHQLEILDKINKRISAVLDLDDVLEAILREGLQSVGTDSGSIMLANPVTNELEIKIWIADGELEDEESLPKLSLGEGIAGHVFATGKPYNSPDVTKDPHFKKLPNGRNCGSLLSVPIVSQGRILGTINADSTEKNSFKKSDADFLSDLINHMVVPIESQILRDVVRSLSALPLDEVLKRIIERACILLGTRSGTVTLVSEETGYPKQAVRLSSSSIDKFRPRKDGLTHVVVTSGEPIMIQDAQQDSRVKQSTKNKGIESIMGVPLKIRFEQGETSEFRVIGALFVNGTQKQQFNNRDLELLQELAGQLAILIENARLGKVVKERDHSQWMASQLLALHQITQAMQSELDLPKLLNLISEQTAKLLRTDSAGILLLDDQKQYLTFKGVYNLSTKAAKGTRDRVGESIAGRVVETGQAIIANDLPNDPRFHNPSADEEGWLAIISTPLVSGGEIIGTLDGHSRSERYAFSDDDLQILSMMATQAAIAIQNTRLFDQTNRRAHALGTLHQTALEITGYRQLPKLMASILDRAVELLLAKGGCLYLLDEVNQQIMVGAASNRLDLAVGLVRDIQDDVVGQVIKTKTALSVPDYRTWPNRHRDNDPYEFTLVAGAPIIWQEKIWGVIAVHDEVEERNFGPEELDLLSLLGNLAAVALQNAELAMRDAEKLGRLEQLAQANSEIMGSLAEMPLDDRFNLIAKHAAKILEAETCAIFLVKRTGFVSLEASYGHREGEFEKGREFEIRSGPKSGLTGHIAYEGKLFNAHGVSLVRHFAAKRGPYHGISEDLYSILAIPLKQESDQGEKLLGLLRADNKKDRKGQTGPTVSFTQEDEWIFRLFADAAVVAIEGAELVAQLSEQKDDLAQLVKTTERRGQLLTTLDEASRHIRAEKETVKLLQEVVRLAAELVGYTAGGLYINYPQSKELELKVTYEIPLVPLENRLSHTEGLIGLVAQTRQPQIIYDYFDWPDREVIFDAYQFNTMVGIPLKHAGEVEAVLFVADNKGLPRLTETDLEILQRFAVQAATTLQTSRLMDREQRKFRPLAILHKVSHYIQAARDLNKTLHVVLTGITAGYGLCFNRAALFLLDERRESLVGQMGIGHLDKTMAWEDWAHHHERGLEDFGQYLEMLEQKGLSQTPVGERINELQLPMTGAAADIFSQVVLEGEYKLITQDELDRLPGGFIEAFEPAPPLIVVPLVARDQVIGILVADNKFTQSPITTEDIESLLTFANTAAVAIENIRLFRETEVARERFRSFYKASNMLVSSLDAEKVLKDIVEQARVAAEASRVSISLIDDMGHAKNLVTTDADQQFSAREVIRQDGLSVEVMRTGKPIIIEDVQTHRARINPKMFEDSNIKAALCLPLSLRGKRIGVMWIHYSQPHFYFSEPETEAIQLYVNQAVIAYDSARRMKELEYMRKAAESLALQKANLLDQVRKAHNAAHVVAEVMVLEDLQSTLESIVHETRNVLGCDVVTLYTYDQDLERFGFPPAMVGVRHRQKVEELGKVAEKSVVHNVLILDELYVTEMAIIDPLTRGPFVEREAIVSSVGIPLIARGRKVGVMFVNYRAQHHFSDDELTNLKLFANQAAVAIHNAQLYQQMTERLDEANALYQAALALTGASDREEVLKAIITEAFKLTNTQQSSILFWDAQAEKFTEALKIEDEENSEEDKKNSKPAERKLMPYKSRARSEGGRARQIIDTRKPKAIFDALQEADFNPVFTDLGHRASLGVPLLNQGEPIGVLYVRDDEPHHFSDRQIKLLQGLASHAVVAIDRARRYEEMKEIKGYIGAHTAVDWIKMVSIAWGHNIRREVGTALGRVALLQNFLKAEQLTPDGQEELDRLKDVIDRIKDIPIIAPLSYEDAIDSVRVNELIKTYLDRQWAHDRYKFVKLHYHLDEDLDHRATVWASREWLRRGLELVVDNAVWAMHKVDSPRQQILVTTRLVNNLVEISLTDTGPGIPKHILDRLFKKPIPKPEGSRGSGIGLMLAQTIFQTYRGDIRMESTGDKGTTMVIVLPVEVQDEQQRIRIDHE